ncbi:plasmid pRiA4b ORF-3 family protein [Arthrobacter sp. AL12]|uniref:plasmid pRiA4b ORF-3 family protein n=1 Tax=Arthrobacter sp. AL12 TaxID=3042241 RepID=UPI00249BB5CC|nr:plasmid pRiA4b ORF-3 family protein [Arthrobacter sp. AL12]MDI3213290.1 plasmid pRiA4b ORF-3 family protein [Arthrobacter sp. AL12]
MESIPALPVPVPAYDLRVSIHDTEPEIWRRLLVPETITVPDLHRVLQTAFGWENRHLFGIRCVDRLGHRRDIIGPDEAAEETGAEPASGVVLFELLDAQKTGPSTLEYEYDFGDAWTHVIEVMGPAELPAGAVRCVGGASRGPVEDAGGTSGYARLIEALANPSHEDHQELSDWYKFATGQDAGTFEPDAFDGAALNSRLDGLAKRIWPEPPTDEEIDAVIRPVQWLLSQAGADGLQLTQDGYLKPAVVSEAVRALGWTYRWPGVANRESQTLPVLRLRQQLQAWKLLRKSKGRLVLSPAGRRMRDGGRPLWDYLVQTVAVPADKSTAAVTRMVIHWLLEGSTPSWDQRARIIADTLTAAGFRMGDGEPVPLGAARDLYSEVRWTLDCLQLKVPGQTFTEEPALTDGGRKFLLPVQGLLEGR